VPVAGEIIRRIGPLLGVQPRSTAEIEQSLRDALTAAH